MGSNVFGRMRILVVITMCVALHTGARLHAQPGPTSRPAAPQRPNPGGALLDRLRDTMADLKLSDEQKKQIADVFETAREKLRELGPELRQLAPEQRQQRFREFLTDLREQILNLLTDEQKTKFEDKMDEIRRGGGLGGGLRGGGAGTGGGIIERLREAVQKLDLSDQQKEKVRQLGDEIREKARVAREEAQGDMQKARQKVQELGAELREKLGEILTPEQQEKLRELMREGAGAPAPAPPPTSAPAEPAPTRRAMAPPGSGKLPPGAEAPAFAVEKLDGRNVQLSSYRGKVLVLLFGNYTSPSFRRRADDFEQLRREYGRRAEFLIIYTRESHAVGQWDVERNKQDGVSIEQPTDLAGRIALAKKARDTLKITIPIAIDTMDDKTATDYDANNGAACVIVGRDGVVAARQNWFDPTVARKQLDEIFR